MNLVSNITEVENVRREIIEGELHYSVIDVICVLLQIDWKTAQNYYHVFKSRLANRGETIPYLHVRKAVSSDGKRYKTEFISAKGIEFLQEKLHFSIEKRKNETFNSTREELKTLHPATLTYLQRNGFYVQHHVQLASGKEIDIVARIDNRIYVIECKVDLTHQSFYKAVGQVLCYRSEYAPNAIAAIACFPPVDDYISQCCKNLGIEIIEVSPNKVVCKQAKELSEAVGFDLVTEKPLLPKKSSK